MPNVDGLKKEGDKRAKKNLDITLHGVWGPGTPSPLKPEVYTAGGEAAAPSGHGAAAQRGCPAGAGCRWSGGWQGMLASR